jgi:hypothetical protein
MVLECERTRNTSCDTFGIFGSTVPQSNGPQLAMHAFSRGSPEAASGA